MIGSLRGQLLLRDEGEVIVDVAGVGYRARVSPTTSVSIGEPGDEVFVWVHHHVKEDATVLYGFRTVDERRTFEALIAANGVGPSLAMAILSVHDPAALRTVIATDDVSALCLVPGVGRKTAAKLLIELKSRLDLPLGDVSVATGAVGHNLGPAERDPLADVREALAGLGYGPDEIREAVRDIPSEGDVAELVKAALQRLAGAAR